MEYIQVAKDKLLQFQKGRFASVGIFNTLFDTSLYTLLVLGSIGPIWANYISTTIAVSVSYFLHRRFTFRALHARVHTSMLPFVLVTLFGVWAIQPLIIYYSRQLLDYHAVILPAIAAILLPKLCAVAVVVFWNYLWYSRVIFRKDTAQNPLHTA